MKLTMKNKKLTPLEKMDIMDLKVRLVSEVGYRCFKCNDVLGGSNPAQLAHMVQKGDRNYKKYGYEVINHPANLMVSCSKCNVYAMQLVKNELSHINNIRNILGLGAIK